MGKKLTYKFIKDQFEKRGCELITNNYINNKQKLKYICPNGHRHSITWNHFKNGCGCPDCVGVAKPTIEFIKSEFEKEGHILLTKEYRNAHQKLEYICSEGHRHNISWNNWYNHNQRCSTCANIKHSLDFSGTNHPNWKGGITPLYRQINSFVKFIGWIKKVFEKNNYICQRCGEKGRNLNAHHIIPVNKILKYYNITDIEEAKNCSLFYDTNNGITLCKNCHKWVHSNKNVNKAFLSSILDNKLDINVT